MHKIDGKLIAQKIDEYSKIRLQNGKVGKLVIMMISNDLPSQTWVERKQAKAKELGINTEVIKFDASVELAEIIDSIEMSNNDPEVAGILVQLPLYPHLEQYRIDILATIDSAKDVDGLNPLNQGLLAARSNCFVPATVLGIVEAINSVFSEELFIQTNQLNLRGQHVVIVNDSILVGRPLSQILLNHGATVTICHEFTANLASYTKTADILISATGQIGLLGVDDIKNDAIIIDVTSIKTAAGFRGDMILSEELYSKAKAYTPVPGGIGPLTVSLLMFNLIKAANANA